MTDKTWDALFEGIPWHQRWEIAPSVFTPGGNPVDVLMDAAAVPQRLDGKRILDIGAWNGCFSFEAERRGAEVLAIGPETAEATGFTKLKAFLGSKVEYRQGTIYHLDPDAIGTFDAIICFGVIYHLRHVLLAFDAMRRVCRRNLFLETASIDHNLIIHGATSNDAQPQLNTREHQVDRVEHRSVSLADVDPLLDQINLLQFYRLNELNNDSTNWFAMNQSCLRDLLLSSGFRPATFTRFGHRLAVGCEVIPGSPEWMGNSGEGVYYDVITKPILGRRDVY